MKKHLIIALAAIFAAFAMQAKSASEVRIYLNAGHGSWGPNDRPMPTIPYPYLPETGRPDTCGFYESNTNLWKVMKLGKILERMGVSHDNIMYSRTANGPYPYVAGASDATKYNRALSEIAREVDANNIDMFISVHSNAATEGSTINYPVYLYRGTDAEVGNAGSYEMCEASWGPHWMNELDPTSEFSKTRTNIHGDVTFFGSSYSTTTAKGTFQGYLGVLRHGTPGFLVEGFFHTYQPARHRALNKDYCAQEGVRLARGVRDYFGLNAESVGYIMGTVKDLRNKMSNSLYNYAAGSVDQWVPLNGATVTLYKGSNAIATYNVDSLYNGIFVFEDLEPGSDYTLRATAAGYKPQGEYLDQNLSNEYKTEVATSLGSYEVKANATTYARLYLEPEGYEPGDDVGNNYPDPKQPDYLTMPEKIDFMADQGTTYSMSGTVKRAIVRGDSTVVLTADGTTPHLYLIQNSTKQLVKELSTKGIAEAETSNAGFYSRLNDIAFSADGQLVGINSVRCQYSDDQVDEGYARGTLRIYLWSNLDADPVQWLTTQSSNNFYRCDMGRSLAVSGAINDCKILIGGTNAGGTYKAVRWLTLYVHDNSIASSFHSEQTINAESNFTEYKLGDNYKAVVSPQSPEQWVVDGSITHPFEFRPTTAGVNSNIIGRFPTNLLGSSDNAATASGISFFRYANHTLMVSPYMNGNAVAGLKLFDVTNGLANATEVSTTALNLGTPVSATYMATGANVVGEEMRLYLLADNTLVQFTNAGVSSNVHGRVMAYGLTATDDPDNNAYNLQFSTNLDASNATITISDADGNALSTIPVGAMTAGTKTVKVLYTDLPGQTGDNLNWSVTLEGDKVTTISRLNSDNATYNIGMTKVDNSPESAHFGRIYVNNYVSGSSDTKGLYVYEPNWQRVNSSPYIGGQSWKSNYRIGLDYLGKVYMSEWGDAASGVYVADPDNLNGTFTQFFEGTRASNGLISNNGVDVGSSTPCVSIGGSGANSRMYVYSEDYMGTQSYGNNVCIYNIGQTDGSLLSTWSTAPSNVFYIGSLQANTNGNVVPDSNGGVWVSQNRTKSNNNASVPSLIYVDASGNVTFNSGSTDWADNLNGSLGAGIAITPDGNTIAVNDGDGVIQFFDIAWNGTTPTLAYKYSFAAPTRSANNAIHEFDFDYAGNLVVGASALGIYSIPTDNNVCTTPARKAMMIVKKNSSGVDDVNAERTVQSVTYVNPAGITSSKPFDGVNIVVTRYTDGSQSVSKQLK